jgi:hypothetical protein
MASRIRVIASSEHIKAADHEGFDAGLIFQPMQLKLIKQKKPRKYGWLPGSLILKQVR